MGDNTRDTAERRNDGGRIELRHEPMRQIVGKMPSALMRYGIFVLIGIVLLLVALAFFIELPDTAGLTKNGENLRLIDLLIMP